MAAPAVGAAVKALGLYALAGAAARRNRLGGCTVGCGCAVLPVLAGAVAAIVVLAAFVTSIAPFAGFQADGSNGSGLSLAPITCNGLQVSQGYGNTRYEHPHTGIDLVCPAGTPVVALVNGRFFRRLGADVPCAFPAGARGGLGMYAEVDADNIQYLYGHLEGFGLTDGATVLPGTVIGFEGSSGCSTGFHLHFEVHIAGRVTNPCPFLPQGYPAMHDTADDRCWGSAPP